MFCDLIFSPPIRGCFKRSHGTKSAQSQTSMCARMCSEMNIHQILYKLSHCSSNSMLHPPQRRNVWTCSRLRLTLVRFSMTCRILQMHRAAALKLPAGLKSGRRLGVDDGLKQLLVCGELYPAVLVGGVPPGCQKCSSPKWLVLFI